MPNLKLTDAQRVVLAAAGARDSGLILPLPKSLASNKMAASKVLQSLLTKRLIAERPAQRGEETWKGEADDRTTLAITHAGLAAVGIDEASEPKTTPKATKRLRVPASGKQPARGTKKSPHAMSRKGAADQGARTPKPSSKLGLLIAALRGRKGASIDELMKATGWQAHSVRGAISGALKKKLGFAVTSTAIEGRGRIYQIEAASK
jgi:hypothetical protein